MIVRLAPPAVAKVKSFPSDESKSESSLANIGRKLIIPPESVMLPAVITVDPIVIPAPQFIAP